MMTSAPLIVVIPHSLGKAGPMFFFHGEKWEGLSCIGQSWLEPTQYLCRDLMRFRVKALGQIAAGTIEAAESYVRLEVTLPAFIARFAEKIKTVVQFRGKLLIEQKRD